MYNVDCAVLIFMSSCRLRAEEAEKALAAERKAREEAEQQVKAAREAAIAFNSRTFIEQDTVLSLAKFADKDPNAGMGADQVQPLIHSLIVSFDPTGLILILQPLLCCPVLVLTPFSERSASAYALAARR
jgi:hypothetical protein